MNTKRKETRKQQEKLFKNVMSEMTKGFGSFIKPITKKELLKQKIDGSCLSDFVE